MIRGPSGFTTEQDRHVLICGPGGVNPTHEQVKHSKRSVRRVVKMLGGNASTNANSAMTASTMGSYVGPACFFPQATIAKASCRSQRIDMKHRGEPTITCASLQHPSCWQMCETTGRRSRGVRGSTTRLPGTNGENGAEAEGGALRGVGTGETIGPNGVAEVGVRTRQRRKLNAVCSRTKASGALSGRLASPGGEGYPPLHRRRHSPPSHSPIPDRKETTESETNTSPGH